MSLSRREQLILWKESRDCGKKAAGHRTHSKILTDLTNIGSRQRPPKQPPSDRAILRPKSQTLARHRPEEAVKNGVSPELPSSVTVRRKRKTNEPSSQPLLLLPLPTLGVEGPDTSETTGVAALAARCALLEQQVASLVAQSRSNTTKHSPKRHPNAATQSPPNLQLQKQHISTVSPAPHSPSMCRRPPSAAVPRPPPPLPPPPPPPPPPPSQRPLRATVSTSACEDRPSRQISDAVLQISVSDVLRLKPTAMPRTPGRTPVLHPREGTLGLVGDALRRKFANTGMGTRDADTSEDWTDDEE